MRYFSLLLFLICLPTSSVQASQRLATNDVRPLIEWVETRMNLMLLPRPEIYINDQALLTLAHFDQTPNITKIGAYRDGVIFISPQFWHPDDIPDQSVIIHELVHYAQDIGYVSYPCAAAREYEAYTLQNHFLTEHGQHPIIERAELEKFSHCP